MVDPTFIEEINHERGPSALVNHRMWSYRLAVKRWFQLYDSGDFLPDLWDFGQTPQDITKLFSDLSEEKLRHVELLKLEFLTEHLGHSKRNELFESRKLRSIEPRIANAWNSLIIGISNDSSV